MEYMCFVPTKKRVDWYRKKKQRDTNDNTRTNKNKTKQRKRYSLDGVAKRNKLFPGRLLSTLYPVKKSKKKEMEKKSKLLFYTHSTNQ